jgi:multidrug efflux pump subunit AcrA (membrane-fusion protein)
MVTLLTACGLVLGDTPAPHPAAVVVGDCRIAFISEAQTPATVAGQIAEIFVKPGDVVKKGQRLARLDDRTARLDFQAKSSTADNKAALTAAQARLDLFRAEFATSAKLLQTGAGSREELEQRRIRVVVAEEELKNESTKLREAAFERDKAAEALARHEIASPIDGVVREVKKHAGEAVQQFESLVHVVSSNPLRIEGEVDLSRRGRLGVGQAALAFPNVEEAELATVYHTGEPTGVVFLDDDAAAFSAADGVLTAVDFATRKRQRSAALADAALRCCCRVDSTPGLLAVGVADGRVLLVRSATFELEATLGAAGQPAVSAVAAVHGWLFVGRENGELAAWEVAGRKREREFRANDGRAHVNRVTSLQASPDGRWLMSAGDDPFVRIWEIAGEKSFAWSGRAHAERLPVRRLGWTPTGDAAAFNSRAVLQLRRPSDGLALEDVDVSAKPPCHFVRFPPAGGAAMTADEEGRILLWRLANGSSPARVARTFVGNPRGVAISDCAFSAKGDRFATACADGAVRVWRLPTLAELDAAAPGRVAFVSPQAEPGAKPRLRFHVEIDNSKNAFVANASATVVISQTSAN